MIIIDNCVLIDGTGAKPIDGGKVLIDGERIIAVGENVPVPAEADFIDAAGMTVMPGLMDLHIHLAFDSLRTPTRLLHWSLTTPAQMKVLHAVNNAKKCLESGFTTLRCMTHADQSNPAGNWGPIVRDAIKMGIIPGPRMLVCGYSLIPEPPRFSYGFFEHSGESMFLGTMPGEEVVGPGPYPPGPWGIRMAVRETISKGADFIKFYVTGMGGAVGSQPKQTVLTMEEITAITDQAHRQGVKCACHAHASEGIKSAVLGGTDSVEHGTYMDDECIELMKMHGTYLVPTLSISYSINSNKDLLRRIGVPVTLFERSDDVWENRIKNIQMAWRAGVKIACGSDSIWMPALWAGESALELELFTKYGGMSSMDSIVAATKTSAEAIGREKDLGTLEVGKLADIIIIDGNPLKDIKILQNLSKIIAVIKGGKIEVDRGLRRLMHAKHLG